MCKGVVSWDSKEIMLWREMYERKKIGVTFSCFDLLHAGHVLMLKDAKQQCDILVVGLQTDPTIDRPEKNKPVTTYEERFTILESIKYVDYILSDQSLKALNEWVKFQELQEEIEKLKNGEVNFFKDDIVLITTLFEELENTIPENINTPEVTTRITVLKNTLFNLNSELKLERRDKNYSLKSIKELLIASSNLKLQINKKLEMDSQNIIKPQ